MGRQFLAAARAGFPLGRHGSDSNEYPADDLGLCSRWRPQFVKLGPRQDSIGAAVGIVNLDLAAVEPEQDAVMPQVGLRIEPMIQNHPGIGVQELSDQFGGLYRLERNGCEALLASIHCEPMASCGLDARTDLFRNALPKVALFT
jgi:hypothetical protein